MPGLSDPPASPAELDRLTGLIDAWTERERHENPMVLAVDREPGAHRWYVRLRGDERDVTTIWLTLLQRSLRYETYVLPAPRQNQAAFFEHLLRRNASMVGAQFCIGDEDAIYLAGAIAHRDLDEAELDRIVGTVWAYVERSFRPALRLGFDRDYFH